MESTEAGAVLAFPFKAADSRGLCWTISVWDGQDFIDRFATGMGQTIEEAKGKELFRLDDGKIHTCRAIGVSGPGPDYIFVPLADIGAGLFRACNQGTCFEFTLT